MCNVALPFIDDSKIRKMDGAAIRLHSERMACRGFKARRIKISRHQRVGDDY